MRDGAAGERGLDRFVQNIDYVGWPHDALVVRRDIHEVKLIEAGAKNIDDQRIESADLPFRENLDGVIGDAGRESHQERLLVGSFVEC